MNDKKYMKKAIKLAKKGKYLATTNPNVGCIIVDNKKKIVGKGWHKKEGNLHAETIAINMAKNKTINSTMYITLEPCTHFGRTPPCYKNIISAKISRVVCAMKDPNPIISGKGIKKLKKAGIKITVGILYKKAKKLNKGFIKRMKTGIPWVTVKMATSIDGRTSLKNGKSKWITSQKSRSNVQDLRAKNQAILSTSNTILLDNSILNIREKKTLKKNDNQQPLRIILDSKNKIEPNQPIINFKSKIYLIKFKKDNKIWPNHVKQLIIPKKNKNINLKHLLYILGNQGINNILIEAGSILFGILLKNKLIDTLILYIGPKILGHTCKPLVKLKTIKEISLGIKLKFNNIKKIGKDLYIELNFKK